MESKKINQLATELAPDLSDLTIIGDPTTGISKKITLSQMASLFTGTVEEYANKAAFPLVGVADTIYVALDTNVLWRWNTGTNAYVELSPNIINSLVFNDANGFDGTISLVGSVANLTITTALTTGSVGFIGASGALLQDNANFFWDDTNNRLGLGTNAPTTALDVFGSGIIGRINGTSTNNAYLGFASAGTNKWSVGNVQSDHRFRIFSEANSAELISVLQTGEFGIGIANPTTKFHIDGGASALIANLDANVSVAKSLSFRSDNSNRINLEVSGTESGSNAGANLFIKTFSDAGSSLNATAFVLKRDTGYVGFGTDTPLTPIHINYALGTTNSALRLVNGSIPNASNITKIALFLANNTGGAEESAAIFAINPNAGGNNGGDLVFATSLNGTATTATEKMRINNAGLIGINTNSPEALLHINKSSAGGEGGFLFLDNSAGSTLGNKSGIRFANDTGASFSGYSSFIESINTDAGTGATALTFGTWNGSSRAERLRINAAGNVGIGITTPSYQLDVVNSTNPSIRVRNGALGGTATLLLETANNFSGTCQAYVQCIGAVGSGVSQLAFGTAGASGDASGTERMRITSGGNLGIGVTSANAKLYVYDTSTTQENFYLEKATASFTGNMITSLCYTAAGTGWNHFIGYSSIGSTTNIKIIGNGNIQNANNSYGSLSDIKLKENIIDATPKLNKLLKVKIRNYNLIGSEIKQIGVIAQELEEIFPSMIEETEDFKQIEITDEKGNISKENQYLGTTTKAVKYSVFVPMLIKAIQEQQQQIEELKILIAAK
jgi:hypothetical protein